MGEIAPQIDAQHRKIYFLETIDNQHPERNCAARTASKPTANQHAGREIAPHSSRSTATANQHAESKPRRKSTFGAGVQTHTTLGGGASTVVGVPISIFHTKTIKYSFFFNKYHKILPQKDHKIREKTYRPLPFGHTRGGGGQ